MKNILVTGAGGFIGFHLCNFLVRQGHQVTGIDIHFPERDVELPFSFEDVHGDFRDENLIRKALNGKDIVFHLASAHLKISLEKSEYWDINVHSLGPFLELVKSSGAQKFIHVSSVGIYGNLETWPADEETVCRPQSTYGETKLAGEEVVNKFFMQTGFPVIILRPAWVYGPGCPRTAKLYRTLKKNRFIMIGKGDNLRHPVYIGDMMQAFKLSMENDEAVGETFIIGGEKPITTNELVEGFSKVFNFHGPLLKIPYGAGKLIASLSEKAFAVIKKEPPVSRRTLEFYDTNNAFDIGKAKKYLKFNPEYSFEAGLSESRDWLEKYAS
ncbi:MAG TPA: NAD(P)-dependent oxidoreductase [Ignavibacteriaceae bacterium]|nr:NAD(P)-dependent oxidoreductase [Ignavibacteriaceae bacterium]